MAFATEHPPAQASVVFTSTYVWQDAEWLTKRAAADALREPMSIYEVHLGSWKQGLGYRQLADELVAYVKDLGFTHVEFLPVAEHPFGGSWGYQVSSYFAPTSRFGTPDDFRFLVDSLHQAGIGVIIDWVPAHFPKDAWALAQFDGTHLYGHSDPRLAGTLTGAHSSSTSDGEKCVTSLCLTQLLGRGDAHRRPSLRCRCVDVVPRLLTQGRPVATQRLRRARESRSCLVLAGDERDHLPARARSGDNRRRVNCLASRLEADLRRRPGFGFKWNMGWMHDSLQYMARRRSTAATTTTR